MKTYAEIEGDGGSRVLEQLKLLRRRISERLSSVGALIAVGSGKGGVGKSTVCMELAFAYRAQGKRIAVLDADMNGPSAAQISGMNKPLLVPAEHGLLVPVTPDGIALLSTGALLDNNEALSFESVARSDSYTWRAAKEFSTLASLLAGVEWGERDVLLIDLPPGAERTVQFAEFFGPELNIVLVAIPTDLSLGVVMRGLDALEQIDSPVLGWIENMSGYLSPESGEIQPLFPGGAGRTPPVPKLGSLPFDPRLASLCDAGMSVAQWQGCPSAPFVQEAAEAVWNCIAQNNKADVRGAG